MRLAAAHQCGRLRIAASLSQLAATTGGGGPPPPAALQQQYFVLRCKLAAEEDRRRTQFLMGPYGPHRNCGGVNLRLTPAAAFGAASSRSERSSRSEYTHTLSP